MTDYPNRGNKKQLVSLYLVGVALALGGCGGEVKNACLKYKEEMGAHVNAEPAISIENGFDDYTSRSTEWIKKGDPINKRLFDAFGITYYGYGENERTIEQAQSNVTELIKAAEKCSNEGVDLSE